VKTHKEHLIEPRPDDALLEVKRTGMHCFLAHRDVFEAIEPPWFRYHEDRGVGNSGEDFYFCEKVREAGFPLYIDRSVIAGHSAGARSIGALDFVAYTSLIKRD